MVVLDLWSITTSLVPRPHPLTRRNGLVNQVEFLGLAHTNLATFKTFCGQPAQRYWNGDDKFYCNKGCAM